MSKDRSNLYFYRQLRQYLLEKIENEKVLKRDTIRQLMMSHSWKKPSQVIDI